jgi:hypothetical protein
MKEKWQDAPSALKKQIYKRLSVGVLFLVLGIITWAVSKDFIFAIPCFVGMIFFVLNGLQVLMETLLGKYVVLSGVCERLEQTRIFKRTKAVYLSTEYGTVKVAVRRNMRRLQIGSQLRCFISVKTSVYQYDGVQVVSDYYALDFIG